MFDITNDRLVPTAFVTNHTRVTTNCKLEKAIISNVLFVNRVI